MLNGMKRTAHISPCGTHRWTLGRSWDETLPVLVVCMFGPSDADDQIDDPTIKLVCHIAAHNGFGGITVVNGIPYRSSKTEPQFAMLDWDKTQEWGDRDALQLNLGAITREVERAGAVLLAWGAIAGQTRASADWFGLVQEAIAEALPDGALVYCLGKTGGGHPKHPLARGKHKVPKDAKLIPWTSP